MKDDYSKKTNECKVVKNEPSRKMINANNKADYSKTESGFKKSKAQKLDSFLGK